MPDFSVLEPAIDPNNRINFLLDWELTMKCNLDCSYGSTGIYGGHDNSTQHPPLDECFATIDFMFEYVGLYMDHKPKSIRSVVLNVYGGESLHHPNIVDILRRVHEVYKSKYQHKWLLTVTTTTNAVVTEKKLQSIIPFIDEFTVSYHSENTAKQKNLFKSNIKHIVALGKRVKCVILMHAKPDLFRDSQAMISWCEENQIRFLPRQLDHAIKATQFNYDGEQVVWFDQLYKSKSYKSRTSLDLQPAKDKTDLANVGRACCGGRSLCKDQSYTSRDFYTENKFPDWYCSVNEFFLYVKQVNGEIYTNKDCKMNLQSEIGPIGHLSDTDSLLELTRRFIKNSDSVGIRCKKSTCFCGLCAPKAQHQNTFNQIMEKYRA
jgi:hypothetical protein